MKTEREKQFEAYYRQVEELEKTIENINEQAQHLGVETRLINVKLYREQVEQLDEIKAYFNEVKMAPDKNTTEAILIIALKQFHQFIQKLKN
ncbi:hypothetical protein [Alkalihalobacterium elongatum]|uniref:hypothetical protein n=1 Tax=Alkalihalobacterium elongatum TaxID=2675466 RepID=UPI001C1F7FA9|nr:hypothetical protein [Alkalihalobacterium elongatum]